MKTDPVLKVGYYFAPKTTRKAKKNVPAPRMLNMYVLNVFVADWPLCLETRRFCQQEVGLVSILYPQRGVERKMRQSDAMSLEEIFKVNMSAIIDYIIF